MTSAPCRRHDRTPSPPEVTRLWDGRDHCRGCVEEICPGLAEFARGRDCLEDSIPYDRSAGLLAWWKFVGVAFGMMVPIGAAFLWAMNDSLTRVLVGAMGIGLGLGMLSCLLNVFRARHVLPTVRVSGGVVQVFRPCHSGGDRPTATFPLAEARWRLGRLGQDSYCRGRDGAIVPNRLAVILQSPSVKGVLRPAKGSAATGSTPEMIRFWRGFLRVAGVPEGR